MPQRGPWDKNYGPNGGPPPDPNAVMSPDYSSVGTGSGDGTDGNGNVVGGSNGPSYAGLLPGQAPTATPTYDDLTKPYIDRGGYDNSPSNELSLWNDAQKADQRNAPQTDWGHANSDYYGQQKIGQSYLDVLSGKAPSVAQMQMQQGLGTAASNSLDVAASARGGNSLLADEAAVRQNAVSAQQGINDSAMLRAQEQAAARQGGASLYGQMRGQSQQQGEFGTQTAMQQQGMNDARFASDQQTIGDRLNTRANFSIGQQSNQTAAAAQEHQASQDRTNNWLTAAKITAGVFTAGASKAAGFDQTGVNVPKSQGLGPNGLPVLGPSGAGQGGQSQLTPLYGAGGQTTGGAQGSAPNMLPASGASTPSYGGGGLSASPGSGAAGGGTPSSGGGGLGGLMTTPTGSPNGGAQGQPQPAYAGLMPQQPPGPKKPPPGGGY